MPISRSSKLCGLLLTGLLPMPCPGAECAAAEAKRTTEGLTAHYTHAGMPWSVSVTVDGDVTIARSGKTTCTFTEPGVLQVFLSSGRTVFLRSTDISADRLLTVDGFTCKELSRPVPLGDGSKEKVARALRARKICEERQ